MMGVLSAQHFHCHEVQLAVSIEIAEVNSHGCVAHVPQRQAVGGLEMTGAVVQPEPVGSLKIVANVDVRQTVAVDVTNLHSQSKVRRWRDRTPIFISKSGFPRNGREV